MARRKVEEKAPAEETAPAEAPAEEPAGPNEFVFSNEPPEKAVIGHEVEAVEQDPVFVHPDDPPEKAVALREFA